MSLYEKIISNEEKISVVGLGYVGMPIAVAFASKGVQVIGFDLNREKIELYKSGVDPTKEVGDDVIKNTSVEFTSNEGNLRKAKFHIVSRSNTCQFRSYPRFNACDWSVPAFRTKSYKKFYCCI